MATKILFEIWDAGMKRCESKTSFDTVDVFLAHAMKFKDRKKRATLRVHIPDSFELSAKSTTRIETLGITRF